MATRNKIFVSYSHKDARLFEEFKTMLAPAVHRRLVDLWDDRKILPGGTWKEEIELALASAKVAVLLVSQNFLASPFITENELPPLLKAARAEGVTIFWVYLSSCLFEQTEIASYQAAHDISRPLNRMSKAQRQDVLSKICNALIQTAGRPVPPFSSTRPALPTPAPPQPIAAPTALEEQKSASAAGSAQPDVKPGIPDSTRSELLRQLLMTFFRRYRGTFFSPIRIQQWGGKQNGFADFFTFSTDQIRSVLLEAFKEGQIDTISSRKGNPLYGLSKRAGRG